MKLYNTLIDLLAEMKDRDREIRFIDGEHDESVIHFGELWERALALLGSLQARGMSPGDELIIFSKSNESFVVAFWAAVLGGIVPVPVAVGVSDEHKLKLFRILSQLQNPTLFTEMDLLQRLHDFAADEGLSDIRALLDTHAVQSVAVGYLHAFVNPEHEQRTAEILQAARPELSITLASEVCPEIREFERLSTACANAYVRPLMARYLERLDGELSQRGFRCPFLLMTSGGGLTTMETACRFPIRLVESGPAGGAILAREVARQAGLRRVLSFDMGGTTAKLSLVDDYEPLMSRSFEVDRVYRFKKGSGLPVRIPVIEMVEIGAGGGSIAQVDKLRRIQVGPESAGSEPGPACYGRGGRKPAVTDADVRLGRVYGPTFAGGAFSLDGPAADVALQDGIAGPLELDLDLAAHGVSEVVDENMAAAARAHAAEFGLDLGSRDMVAFGGAAPLHAARLGEKLGVRRIIVPAAAGSSWRATSSDNSTDCPPAPCTSSKARPPSDRVGSAPPPAMGGTAVPGAIDGAHGAWRPRRDSQRIAPGVAKPHLGIASHPGRVVAAVAAARRSPPADRARVPRRARLASGAGGSARPPGSRGASACQPPRRGAAAARSSATWRRPRRRRRPPGPGPAGWVRCRRRRSRRRPRARRPRGRR